MVSFSLWHPLIQIPPPSFPYSPLSMFSLSSCANVFLRRMIKKALFFPHFEWKNNNTYSRRYAGLPLLRFSSFLLSFSTLLSKRAKSTENCLHVLPPFQDGVSSRVMRGFPPLSPLSDGRPPDASRERGPTVDRGAKCRQTSETRLDLDRGRRRFEDDDDYGGVVTCTAAPRRVCVFSIGVEEDG